ncbi:MAG: OmpA family protein, partial [Proteobacteria bacterium]|nr:OmpA family protein [Pseudomonadota bacterium]
MHLFANHTLPSGLGMTVGAGTGFIAGLGAPEYRVFTGFTYANLSRDGDGDGYVDAIDGCPEDPEDFDEFEDEDGCPDTDNDGDTIADVSDSCPMKPEDFDEFEDGNGCPDPDNDGDGILDADDTCPIERGKEFHLGCPDQDLDGLADTDDLCPDESGPWETRGCPDLDMDEVFDERDQCPTEPRSMDDPPDTSNGCPPTEEVISGGMIRLGEKMVHFDSGSHTLKSGSHPALNELAELLKANPGIKRGEISGHTDNEGGDSMNMRLSQQRAEAVLNYMAERGISRSRLVARGYGELRNIDTNRTARGRAKNRRVEFRILEQQDGTLRQPGEVVPLQRGAVTIELSSTWGFVTIDGRKVNQPAPLRQLPLLIGSHDIRVHHEKEGLNYEVTVTIAVGETTTITVPFGDQSGHEHEPNPDETPWDLEETPTAPAPRPEEAPSLEPEEAAPLDEIGEPWILEEAPAEEETGSATP